MIAHSTLSALHPADSTVFHIGDTANGSDDALAAAIRYRDLGWSIIPIAAGKKKPACKSWKTYQRTPASESKLRSWFAGKPHGMAVVLGDASGGLLCRDFDELGAYQRWAADHGALANTLPTVETSRGRHVYFRTAEGSRVKRTADGEIRGSGGYSVLPPSRHPSGTVYRWLIEPADAVPEVDPLDSGLLGSRYTESAENAETAESADVIVGGGCVCVDAGLPATAATCRATTFAELADWPSGTIEALKESLPTAVGNRNVLLRENEALAAFKQRVSKKGLRHYIWHQFKKRCFKCDTPVALKDYELDHTRSASTNRGYPFLQRAARYYAPLATDVPSSSARP